MLLHAAVNSLFLFFLLFFISAPLSMSSTSRGHRGVLFLPPPPDSCLYFTPLRVLHSHVFWDRITCFYHHFYFPALLVGGFTLAAGLLDKTWPQLSYHLHLPPGTCLHFCRAVGFVIPTVRTRALAFSACQRL